MVTFKKKIILASCYRTEAFRTFLHDFKPLTIDQYFEKIISNEQNLLIINGRAETKT